MGSIFFSYVNRAGVSGQIYPPVLDLNRADSVKPENPETVECRALPKRPVMIARSISACLSKVICSIAWHRDRVVKVTACYIHTASRWGFPA